MEGDIATSIDAVMVRAGLSRLPLPELDLLPHLDFDMALFMTNLHAVNSQATTIHASARTGDGIQGWCSWLLGQTSASS